MHTRYLVEILGKKAVKDIKKGTPLSWDLVKGLSQEKRKHYK